MTGENIPVKIKIMDKEFQIACPESERPALEKSANHLNQHMKKVKDSGKVFGAERIAIMAALNLTHELLQQKDESLMSGESFSQRLSAMQEKVETALQDTKQMEF